MIKIISCPSPNFENRKDKISFLILHATATRNLEHTFSFLIHSQKPKRVSAHYVIDRNGLIYRLVDDDKRAFHAGLSNWKGYGRKTGRNSLNDASIGIEFQCAVHEGELQGFTKKQINAGLELCRLLMEKHKIEPKNVLAHSDVAPNRRKDPGLHFPWRIFGKAGIGLWTDRTAPKSRGLLSLPLDKILSDIGYPMNYGKEINIIAFKRHFMPHAKPDASVTKRILKKATALLEASR